ncbi:MAG: hypothetical protein J3K34DRAFT_414797 [Monoraphidium minutum]|nr:MAG: hypothetical protein J3K34DRAFT_414797 [Monoraphidium minutum]
MAAPSGSSVTRLSAGRAVLLDVHSAAPTAPVSPLADVRRVTVLSVVGAPVALVSSLRAVHDAVYCAWSSVPWSAHVLPPCSMPPTTASTPAASTSPATENVVPSPSPIAPLPSHTPSRLGSVPGAAAVRRGAAASSNATIAHAASGARPRGVLPAVAIARLHARVILIGTTQSGISTVAKDATSP